MDTIDIVICASCASVLANGECGECALHDVDPCPHGGNERIPARAVTVDEPADIGWVVGGDCYLHGAHDGEDWWNATLWIDELPPLVSLAKDEDRATARGAAYRTRWLNRFNMWGTRRGDVNRAEFCQYCERQVPYHYASCQG